LLSKSLKIKIYSIILQVVLYECETWSLTLREECRLRIFENKLLRRIFGPKRDEVRREWGRLHNKEFYTPYFSPQRLAGYVARIEEKRGAYRILVAKPEESRPLGKPRRRWENVKNDLREVGWGGGGGIDWIDLPEVVTGWVVVNALVNLRFP
jgi:hypothetical protein